MSLSDHVYIQCVASTVSPCSFPLLRSSLYEGLLVPLDTPSMSLQPLLKGRVRQTAEGILTAVFQISLAGDWPEGMCVCVFVYVHPQVITMVSGSEFSVEGVCGVSVDDVVVEELMETGRVLVERGVGLIACQKCVHPALKDYLKGEVHCQC